MRVREVPAFSFEECELRALLEKEWSKYRREQFQNELKAIQSMMRSQRQALLKLREESEELYQMAIEVKIPSVMIVKGEVWRRAC